MRDSAALVEAGRQAYAAAAWETALESLTAVRAGGTLEVDDLAIMARSAWWLSRLPESLSLSEEVFRGYCDLERPSDAAQTALQLGLLWITRGDVTIGEAWMNRARRLLADLPEGREHAYLVYLEAAVALVEGREAWSDERVARLAELSSRFREPAIDALSMVTSGMAELRRGDTWRGFALLDDAMLSVLADAIAPEWAGDIYCTTIHVCYELADFRRMEDWTKAMERWCRRYGTEAMYTGICRVHRLELRSARGDWSGTEALLARESADLADVNPWVAGEGFYQLGEIRRLRGDVAGAREAYRAVRASGGDPQPGEALLALREGDAGSAWAAVSAALSGRDRVARARLLRPAVEIALAVGRRADAEALATELRESAEHFDSRGFRAWASHAEGMVAVTQRDPDTALHVLRAAEDAFRANRQPYESARVLELMAEAHELAGHADAATGARARADGILARLGMDSETAVRDTGPLTMREAEVLECVAQGASNRDVAARLSISEKTVGRHLANVYMKLGVGSRTAAAAWWREHARG